MWCLEEKFGSTIQSRLNREQPHVNFIWSVRHEDCSVELSCRLRMRLLTRRWFLYFYKKNHNIWSALWKGFQFDSANSLLNKIIIGCHNSHSIILSPSCIEHTNTLLALQFRNSSELIRRCRNAVCLISFVPTYKSSECPADQIEDAKQSLSLLCTLVDICYVRWTCIWYLRLHNRHSCTTGILNYELLQKSTYWRFENNSKRQLLERPTTFQLS